MSNFAILFVDDEPMARKYFEKALKNVFPVFIAEDVASAIELLREKSEQIGVLITDQRMPGDNGIVLLRYVRRHFPTITRMITTASPDLNDAVEAVNKGEVFRYIQKPWSLEPLMIDVRQAMELFELRHSRNLLIREKLSVKSRYSQVNRLRDLMLVGGSFGHLRGGLVAVGQFLLQFEKLLPEAESDVDESFDVVDGFWQSEIVETQAMLELVAQLSLVFHSTDNFLFDCEVDGDGLVSWWQRHSDKLLVKVDKCSKIQVNRFLIEYLCESMFHYFSELGGQDACVVLKSDERCLQGQEKAVSVVVMVYEAHGVMWPDDFNVMRLAVGAKVPQAQTLMLACFLIAYHHGGDVRLTRGEEGVVTCEIVLPVAPELVDFDAVDVGGVMEDVFVMLI